ncbi:tail fiber protein, putative [Trichomonas vaginalis G3]|uniref:Tail fiber protein, putative n=1 Tax=Trichomonas vaginalis (strain ATCC PRA-98 / G3) TaxID=412133 RepID=A2GM35_TRIV3|nr:tail fiber protein, putative [Trichomonas vaginalis G3]|eukprot:XP_001294712.1 tail fiber protein [Trichomonas vaginalis G3]
MIKQQQPQQLKAQTITYATYAYNSKTAEQTQRLKYGDLEIVLKNDHFEFVCKGGAVISNIKEILFMNSKIKGITDDITSIPPEEQRYYALNAFPKVLKIGRFNLNEEFIKGFLNDIMKKADKEYVDSELEKKADMDWTSATFNVKADTKWVLACLDNKADKEYVDSELNKKADMDWTSATFNVKADTKWVLACLDNKADKEWVNTKLNTILEMIYPIGSIYTSMNSTNPASVLGFGTWQQITDRFLYCANSSKQTGGSKTITGENLPAHSHYVNLNTTEAGWHKHRYWDWSGMTKGKGYDVKDDVKFAINCYWNDTQGSGNHTHNVSGYTQTTGQSKDYMPPYMTVYAWFRTD